MEHGNMNLEFKTLNDKRFVLEEEQNQIKVLRLGMWCKDDAPIDPDRCRYEIRTMYVKSDGTEQSGKGCSLSEEGVNELANVLVAEGKGYTRDLLESMKTRSDFGSSLKRVLGKTGDEDIDSALEEIDDEFFDASSLLSMSPEADEEGA
jgi:hypothetical protein